MADRIDELADFLGKSKPVPFKPAPYLEPETDSLIFYVRDVPSYSNRVNQLFTLFLSAKDDTLVGCEIKGVGRILRRSRGFLGVFHDHKIKLTILIALALVPEPEEALEDYDDALNDLRGFAEHQDVDTGELCLA